MLRPILFTLLAFSLPAAAQIYKYTDANGNTVFSDQIPADRKAQSIELPPVNAIPKQVITKPINQHQPVGNKHEPYAVLRLTGAPDNGDTVRANNGSFAVNVEIEPSLNHHHHLRLLLDGVPYGEASKQSLFQLVHLDRGEHSLAVEVLNGDTTIQQSETKRFTVQRVHKK